MRCLLSSNSSSSTGTGNVCTTTSSLGCDHRHPSDSINTSSKVDGSLFFLRFSNFPRRSGGGRNGIPGGAAGIPSGRGKSWTLPDGASPSARGRAIATAGAGKASVGNAAELAVVVAVVAEVVVVVVAELVAVMSAAAGVEGDSSGVAVT